MVESKSIVMVNRVTHDGTAPPAFEPPHVGTKPRPARVTFRIVVLIVLASALLGAAWGLFAPVERLTVVAPNRGLLMPGESEHRFDALAVFLLGGFALGIATGIGSWLARSVRGPAMAIVVVAASIVGALIAAGVGLGVGALSHRRPESPAVGDLVAFAPGLSTPLALLAQPLAAAVVLLLAATLSSHDDLRGDAVAEPDLVSSNRS